MNRKSKTIATLAGILTIGSIGFAGGSIYERKKNGNNPYQIHNLEGVQMVVETEKERAVPAAKLFHFYDAYRKAIGIYEKNQSRKK